MSTFKQLFSCCFPEHIQNAIINNAEEKVDLSLSQITTVLSKNEVKPNGDPKPLNQTSKNQSLLCSQGTAIFNVQTIAKTDKTPLSQADQMEPYPSNRIITQEQIANAPTLTVKDISNKNIFSNSNTEIAINAGGLEKGGSRKENDGVVFFGLSNNNTNSNINTNPNTNEKKDSSVSASVLLFASDVELLIPLESLPSSDKNLIETFNPFVFVIYYVKETNSYRIKFSLDGSTISKNVFIKLAPGMEIPITQPEILSLGSILLCITPCELGQIDLSLINNQLSRKTFSPSDKIITIGRAKTCSYSFDNLKGFSRIQSTLCYNEQKMYWVLKDGSGTHDSKNGTWLFGINSYQICTGMIIEVCRLKMEITIND